jgi:hypothetical protein
MLGYIFDGWASTALDECFSLLIQAAGVRVLI